MMKCDQCENPMKRISRYYYDCPVCPSGKYIPDENGFIPANPYQDGDGLVIGYVLPEFAHNPDNAKQKPVSFESLKNLADNPFFTLEAIREHTGMIRYYALRNDVDGLKKESLIIDRYAQEAYQAIALLLPLLYEITEHAPEHVTDDDTRYKALLSQWGAFVDQLAKKKSEVDDE